MNVDLEYYKSILKQRLTKGRYEHSLNVAKTALFLAKRYHISEEKAEISGLLHDITKDATTEEQLTMINEYGIQLDNMEMRIEKLWHAKTGAAYVKNVLGISNDGIINAIRYHTTGRREMSDLEKVVFVSDFISSERNFSGVDAIREAAKTGLESALIACLSFSVSKLAESKRLIYQDTYFAYNDIILRIKQENLSLKE